MKTKRPTPYLSPHLIKTPVEILTPKNPQKNFQKFSQKKIPKKFDKQKPLIIIRAMARLLILKKENKLTNQNFHIGDRVDVYNEGKRIYKNLIIGSVNGSGVMFNDENLQLICHVDDLRLAEEPEPVKKNIYKYKVVESREIDKFEFICGDMMNEGWVPLSGVFICNENFYCQSFHKRFIGEIE